MRVSHNNSSWRIFRWFCCRLWVADPLDDPMNNTTIKIILSCYGTVILGAGRRKPKKPKTLNCDYSSTCVLRLQGWIIEQLWQWIIHMMMMESDSSNSDSNQETTEPQRRLLSLAVLGSSIFLAGCTLSILAPFYTKEAEDHGLSVTSSGTVFASAFILQIVSTPVFGKYLHKIGSKRFARVSYL